MSLRDRLFDGALDVANGLMAALVWALVGAVAVLFTLGVAVIVRTMLSWVW